MVVGSSPLARGAQLEYLAIEVGVRLIPAHAGSTLSEKQVEGGLRAHPRSRGEHVDSLSVWRVERGSSPLTRGALPTFWRSIVTVGLIPAHAGSTLTCHTLWRLRPAHPRSRGEHD